MFKEIILSLKMLVLTLLFCSVVYPAVVWSFAQAFVPASANGHIIHDKSGRIIGSMQVAQKFTRPEYFHCRPSAVDYNGKGSGGSNLSPASQAFRERVQKDLRRLGATRENPAPVDLVTASGSGLDPHISLQGALFQLPRVAKARGLQEEEVKKLVLASLHHPGGFVRSESYVNVLELNLKLDGRK